MLCFQCFHRRYYHCLADPMSTVILIHAYMIETAPSSVMSAKDASDNPAILLSNHTGRRIPLQKPVHAFPGIVDTANAKSADFLPQRIYFIIIFDSHYPYHYSSPFCPVIGSVPCITRYYGNIGTRFSPSASSIPNIRFIF